MSWAIGFDERWQRDIGYGVPATCDHPGCGNGIDRGLSYVCCDEEPYGGNEGGGLYFCGEHRGDEGKCERCAAGKPPFAATADTAEWTHHKATHPSWAAWRAEQEVPGHA